MDNLQHVPEKKASPHDVFIRESDENAVFGIGGKVRQMNHDDPDPRQATFWAFYLNVQSPTYKSGLASAKRAGYSEWIAKRVTQTPWFKVGLRARQKHGLMRKAERTLGAILEADSRNGLDNLDTSLVRIQADASKFVLDRLSPDYKDTSILDITSQGERVVNISYVTPEAPKITDVVVDN